MISGDQARYPNVLPGDDLVVKATDLGFSVSMSIEAAPSTPTILVFPLDLTGLTVQQTADSIQFADATNGLIAVSALPELETVATDPSTGLPKTSTTPQTDIMDSPSGPELWVDLPNTWPSDPTVTYPFSLNLLTAYVPTLPSLYQNDDAAAAAFICPTMPWQVLAAIGTVESDNGLSSLPGVHSGANFAGAEGPMQFLPSSFAAYAEPAPDGGPNPPSPYDATDAIVAAARYLCANGAGSLASLPAAVLAYNHADWYVSEVLTLADAYGAVWPAATTPGGVAVRFALDALGTPYTWGGNGPGTYDCSGLVKAAYLSAGVSLPRVAQDQFNTGPTVVGRGPLQFGNLVFFGSSSANVSHVGIYIGVGLMINAPHTGANVEIDTDAWSDYIGASSPT